MLLSDKTSGWCFECYCRLCEVSSLDWLMNWQKPCTILPNTYQQCSPWHLFLSQEDSPCYNPPRFFASCFFIYSSSLFHNLVLLQEEKHVSNYLRAIYYKWHSLHCAAQILGGLEKMGFAFTRCSSVLMNGEIEGRKAFIFAQNAMPGHEYLLSLSDYLVCEKSFKGSWSCLREHWGKIWSAAVNYLKEAFTIQVTWRRFLLGMDQREKESIISSHYHSTSELFLFQY